MKLKINSSHLIYMILIQIMLIDVLVIFFLAGGTGFRRNVLAADNAQAGIAENGQKSMPAGTKIEASGKRLLAAIRDKAKASPAESPENTAGTGVNTALLLKSPLDTGYEIFEAHLRKNGPVKGSLFAGQGDLPTAAEKKDFKITGQAVSKKGFVATAYDLSYQCCGKYPSHPEYGITYSGKKAVKGRTVAVDPAVIPLGSSIHIEFPKQYSHLDGWYVAEDTGSKVKGKVIDVYMGESAGTEMKKFGRRDIKVTVIAP